MKIVMPETKQRGDSPLKLIILSFIITFFVALFAWQIEKYLVASHDSKLQGQISRMNLLIEADSLDAFSNQNQLPLRLLQYNPYHSLLWFPE